jgi:hypothetical protein
MVSVSSERPTSNQRSAKALGRLCGGARHFRESAKVLAILEGFVDENVAFGFEEETVHVSVLTMLAGTMLDLVRWTMCCRTIRMKPKQKFPGSFRYLFRK